ERPACEVARMGGVTMSEHARAHSGRVGKVAACVALVTSALVATSLGSTATAAAPSGTPILIGGVAQLTSPLGSARSVNADLGAEARYARANKEGGIGNRPIKYTGTIDDGGDATAKLNALRKQVLDNHVVIVAPLDTIATSDPTQFMTDNKTPFVGYGV